MIAWLQAWMLWALPLTALPLLIHLLRRRQAERVLFPSIRFVPSSPAAAVRLRAPSDIALLLVRTGVVLAAVLAAAQPLWVTAGRRASWDARVARALVIDTSPSMRAGRAAEEAREAAAREAEATFAARFESDSLVDGVRRAAAWLAAAPPARREIAIVSDFQLGALRESLLAVVPAEAGIRLVQVGAPPASRQIDGVARLGAPNMPASRERFAISQAGTEVLGSAPAAASTLRVEGGTDSDTRRLVQALALAGTPAPDSARPMVLRFAAAAHGGEVHAPHGRWMLRTLLGIERDLDLARLARRENAAAALDDAPPWVVVLRDRQGAPLVRAASAEESLVLEIAAPLGGYFAAAAARAALAAAADTPRRDEEEVLRETPEALLALARPAAPVGSDAWRRAESSDGGWFWGAALLLLAIEGWLRSRVRASSQGEARAAA